MNKIYLTNQQGTFVTLLMSYPSFLARIKFMIQEVKAVYQLPAEYTPYKDTKMDYELTQPQDIVDIDFDENGVFILVNFPIQEYKKVSVIVNVGHGNENRVMTPEEIIKYDYLDKVTPSLFYLELK